MKKETGGINLNNTLFLTRSMKYIIISTRNGYEIVIHSFLRLGFGTRCVLYTCRSPQPRAAQPPHCPAQWKDHLKTNDGSLSDPYKQQMPSKDASLHVPCRKQVMLLLGSLTQTTPLSLSTPLSSTTSSSTGTRRRSRPTLPGSLFLIHRDALGKKSC